MNQRLGLGGRGLVPSSSADRVVDAQGGEEQSGQLTALYPFFLNLWEAESPCQLQGEGDTLAGDGWWVWGSRPAGYWAGPGTWVWGHGHPEQSTVPSSTAHDLKLAVMEEVTSLKLAIRALPWRASLAAHHCFYPRVKTQDKELCNPSSERKTPWEWSRLFLLIF